MPVLSAWTRQLMGDGRLGQCQRGHCLHFRQGLCFQRGPLLARQRLAAVHSYASLLVHDGGLSWWLFASALGKMECCQT